MAPSTRIQKRNKRIITTAIAFVIALAVIVGLAIAAGRFLSARAYVDPATLELNVTVAENTTTVSPYTVCEVGTQCADGEVHILSLNDSPTGTVTIAVPEDVYDHEWTLLAIYDDPAQNEEQTFTAHEKTSVDLPSEKAGAKLMIVEANSVQVSQDDAGEETPVIVTWSVADEEA